LGSGRSLGVDSTNSWRNPGQPYSIEAKDYQRTI
jgi:hypothetical protein